MQLRFNVWPGDSSFGGDFDPAILPVYEYIDWVEYSAYNNGAFEVQWREDFTDGKLPSGWNTGSWDSPKGLSTHSEDNVGFMDGYIVLALTADEATGFATANPRATDTLPPPEPSASVTETSAPPATSSATSTDTGVVATSAPSATTTPGLTMDPETTDAAGCSCTLGASRTRRSPVPALAIGAALALTVSRLRRASKRNSRALDGSN